MIVGRNIPTGASFQGDNRDFCVLSEVIRIMTSLSPSWLVISANLSPIWEKKLSDLFAASSNLSVYNASVHFPGLPRWELICWNAQAWRNRAAHLEYFLDLSASRHGLIWPIPFLTSGLALWPLNLVLLHSIEPMIYTILEWIRVVSSTCRWRHYEWISPFKRQARDNFTTCASIPSTLQNILLLVGLSKIFNLKRSQR